MASASAWLGETRSGGSRPADLAGYLHKRGHVNTAFRRRFFVLRGSRLTYYEDEAAADRARSKGSVNVTRVRHLRPGEAEPLVVDDGLPASHLPFAFHFETTERKPFFVYAESTASKLEWLLALHQARLRGGAASTGVNASAASSASSASPWGPGGGGWPQHGGAMGTMAAVEDTYREHVSAAEAGLEATLGEPVAWRHLADGVAHARAGRVADAEAAYAAALTDGDAEGPSRRSVCKEPVALAALHESGKLHCAHGRYLEALGCFERAVALAPPEAARALRLRVAWCSWQLGSHEKAEALYTSLLEVHPVCAHTLLDRARMRLHLARWVDARTDLALVVTMGGAAADVHNDLGVCHYELNEPTEAISALARAVEAAAAAGNVPTHANALANRGNAYRALLQVDEAMADYNASLALGAGTSAGTTAQVLNNRGALLLFEGRYAAAIADLEEAVRLQPSYDVAVRNLEAARVHAAGEESEEDAESAAAAEDGAAAPREGEAQPVDGEASTSSRAAGRDVVLTVPVVF